ncbi:hypothetical protein [Pseudomonas sp. S36]|uniref:hypothetical protein n=1 Tax=Pseudomonas sp. S36 TaxID=2767447 RepID=UPI00191244EE|nr:hypothetical protein [Pseudomonas sp. S36]MBK4988303.1 hypothetical protein [Pseudomonas sp. S36]
MITAKLPLRLDSVNPYKARQLALTENPRNGPPSGMRTRSMGPTGKLWKPGRLLKVSFVSKGSEALKARIYELGRSWIDLSSANLLMERVEDNDQSAEIRICCAPEAYLNGTHLGTNILESGSPNLMLCFEPGEELFEFTVLHEFGHIFGLDHEHQHPEADIPWNDRAMQYYARELGGASEEEVRKQVFDKRPSADLVNIGYDPHSVMHYPVEPFLTTNGWQVGINAELTEKDLSFMREAYPR